jgi:DNA-binding NtrC family response regulator
MAEAQRSILVVDDEPAIRDSLKLLLQKSFHVDVAADGVEALAAVSAHKPDLILLDVSMPKADGFEVLRQLTERREGIPVIMLTAVGSISSAVKAMKCGARDFLTKPFDITELTSLIVSTLEASLPVSSQGDQTIEPQIARPTLPPADFGPMVGRSVGMVELFAQISQIAARDSSVLITGESGTGKELVAREIHARSARAQGPFVALNCAAIPESLIESELFGHEKGAFTHAVERRLGQFEVADGGTLFLDEIGELSLSVQVKLLRFLQEQEFYRVGRTKPIRVNVRIVTATNKNLEELVKAKQFRQDLYYRINVINLAMPALRDRPEDIPSLLSYFVKKLGQRYGERALTIAPEALGQLALYEWPGNVRELENVVESLLALSQRDEVALADLPRKIREQAVAPLGAAPVFAAGVGFEEAERRFETEMIVKALRRANFVQTRAADMLGISRRILKYKMDKLRINERGEVSAAATRADEAAGEAEIEGAADRDN